MMGGRGRWISKFEASIVYRANSRIARDTQTLSQKKKRKNPKKTKLERDIKI